MGVDPLAEKYPAISPFTYVFNNPIRLVDPNGMEVDDIIIEGHKYIPGTSPSAESSDFVKESFAALNEIVNGNNKNASNLVIGLSSNEDIEIELVPSNLKTEAQVGLGKINGNDIIRKYQTIYFDTDRGIEETTTGKSLSPDVALVHELGHIQNAIDNPTEFINRKNESDPVWFDLE